MQKANLILEEILHGININQNYEDIERNIQNHFNNIEIKLDVLERMFINISISYKTKDELLYDHSPIIQFDENLNVLNREKEFMQHLNDIINIDCYLDRRISLDRRYDFKNAFMNDVNA